MEINMLLAFSDFLVLDALRVLASDGRPVTYCEIVRAMPTQCSTRTVARSVARLERAGHIERYGPGHKIGYLYKVLTPGIN